MSGSLLVPAQFRVDSLESTLLYLLIKGAADFLGVTVAGSEFCQDATGDFLADNDAFCQTRYTYKTFMDNKLTVCLETVYNKKCIFLENMKTVFGVY